MSTEITRYDVAGWEADVDESPTGPYVLFSDHEKAMAEVAAERDRIQSDAAVLFGEEWRRSVQAVHGDPEKAREHRLAALVAEIDDLKDERDRLKIERDGALHSSETWELLHAKVHEELDQATTRCDPPQTTPPDPLRSPAGPASPREP